MGKAPAKAFEYSETNSYVCSTWKDGTWGPVESLQEPYQRVHIAATALHYGQAVFEGLKAHACKDGKVRLFRADQNAARLAASADRVAMPTVPLDLFMRAVKQAVRENMNHVPEYGSGGSLYIRPFIYGSSAEINLYPAEEYKFIVFVVPVGNFYEGGVKPVRALVVDDVDRAAPLGVGNVKVAGNYGIVYKPSMAAKAKGFPITLYLDAKEHVYVEEFSSSNFIAISGDGTRYITPLSSSILPSITNNTLCSLAEEMGLVVERRRVALDEVAQFSEVGACGTAVVITPVSEIVRGEQTISIKGTQNGMGPTLQKLYERVRAIQLGEAEDTFGWVTDVESD